MREQALSDPVSTPDSAARSGSAPPLSGTEAAPRAAPARPRRAGRGDPLRRLIRGLDRLLRRLLGIAEFSGHPHCLLRIARAVAKEDAWLADGCRIRRGAALLDLHLWNEHVWSLPSPRRGLARASALRRQLGASLRELAARVETDPALGEVMAVRARAAFVRRKRMRQVLHIARAFGFDAAVSAAPARRRYGFGENLLMWALAWTFNPSTLRRNGVLRDRCELWISRTALLARHGGPASAPLGRGRSAEACGGTVAAPRFVDGAHKDRRQARASLM